VRQRLGEAVLPALQGTLATEVHAKSASSPHGISACSYTSDSKSAPGNSPEAPPKALYRNCFTAIRADIAYRPSTTDQHGTVLHPKPTVYGQQSAIVVGPAGQDIYTDRDHRIKVQFHWARGASSHSRLAHPATEGHTSAPADHTAGTWVRVLSAIAPTAGANWGGTGVPRIGQEVLIDFLEGDIDRPVVIGALYNGQGNSNQAHNQATQGAGVATGNAPMWFPGEGADPKSGPYDSYHGAALSGIKTQSMGASQSGVGSQFTSEAFTGALKREDIAISMDGRGRAYDNIFVERLWRSVKHEDVYLHGYATMGELLIGLTKYFDFYNTERPHQSLGNLTPQEVHKTSSGGGAMIVDKYRAKERLPVALRSSGTAFEEVRIESESAIPIAKPGQRRPAA
jgi:hypothetical protein